MQGKLFLILGAVNALLAVLLGAFGAHAIRSRLTPDLLSIYQTGVQYHFYHALGLLIIGLVVVKFPASPLMRWAGWLMLVGIVLFSGGLYLLSAAGLRALGAVVPLGGIAFIAAWLLLCGGLLRKRP